eukprot:CAMPEP_0198695528 /NCGR_PEP_ID=MMETSP1468-20131203/289452_1 /TAXON_ID=1461545 /ORGANISM="Mantoniella sp, Strain CCMP1436" /LENGTH=159 /DNA_ID=CAMNT_0044451301 /DNA_START=273 /DNA_END=752 /DNA_ORIENTATION=-
MNSKPQPLPLNTDNGAARLSDQVNAQLRHPSQTAAGSENDLDEIEAESPWTSEANHQWHKLYHENDTKGRHLPGIGSDDRPREVELEGRAFQKAPGNDAALSSDPIEAILRHSKKIAARSEAHLNDAEADRRYRLGGADLRPVVPRGAGPALSGSNPNP